MSTLRVGWVGTGVMGCHMCGHVLAGGFPVVVHTRTKSKAAPLLERGAQWAEHPADVAAKSDAVFTIVGLPDDVREIYLGPRGLLSAVRPGQILVDMTTSQPALAKQLAASAGAMGVFALDAPDSLESEKDRDLVKFARMLTVDPALASDEDFSTIRKHYDDKNVAEIVYQATEAAFFDRATEAAGLTLEP